MFVEGLFKLISSNGPIAALLGTARSDKTPGVFPVIAPNEATMPYIVYLQVSGQQVQSLAGANALTKASFRFQSYGANYKQAKQLTTAICGLLNGFTGTLTDGSRVQQTIKGNEAETAEPIPHGTIYGVHVDFEFWYIAND